MSFIEKAKSIVPGELLMIDKNYWMRMRDEERYNLKDCFISLATAEIRHVSNLCKLFSDQIPK